MIEKLKQLIFLAEEHDLNEIEVQYSFGKKIKIVRGAPVAQSIVQNTQPSVAAVKDVNDSVVKDDVDDENEGLIEITAPIVGTFYRKPAPDDDPYIGVGEQVEKGKVVCLIEAMKIFNEIKSEVSGKVVKVLVEDGQPVEYGHTLYLVDPKA